MTARADRHRTDATALTVDARELIELLREIGRAIRTGNVATVRALVNDWHFSPDHTADRLQSLLSEVEEAEATIKLQAQRICELSSEIMEMRHPALRSTDNG